MCNEENNNDQGLENYMNECFYDLKLGHTAIKNVI